MNINVDVALITLAGLLLAAVVLMGFIAFDLCNMKNDMNIMAEANAHVHQEMDDVMSEYQEQVKKSQQLLSDELAILKAENKELRQIILDSITEPQPEETEEKSTSKDRLPEDISTNMFRCEDYRKLNVVNSEQYKLQQECMTDLHTGIRFLCEDGEEYLCAALGTAYGITIGDAWQVTLKCGSQFNIIMADFKHPIDNIDPEDFGDNDLNYDGYRCINVIEFVCDLNISPKAVIDAGTMSMLPEFGGIRGDGADIVSMKYLGRKWNP